MNQRILHATLFLSLLIFLKCSIFNNIKGQSGYRFHPDDPIPVDSSITIGQLDNGLRYYIRENGRPENRVELRLVVDVGSVLEDEDQQGVAHFIEHMAFNGTKNFKKQDLIDYLESIGMKFGPDINAYTDFDETVYMLEIPTDSVDIIERALQILEDWAHHISFEDEEIDKERSVIIEEWRLGRGAQARMRDKQFPILFKGSRYANRLPIGKKEVVDTCHYEVIRRFYHKWYRPDLMAVVVVGDIDKKRMEVLVKRYFSRLPAPSITEIRPLYRVPDHQETLFAIATDPEATSSQVNLYYKKELRPERTVFDYRRLLLESLYDGLMNERFYELTRKADPPFLFGYGGQGRFVRSKDVYYLSAGVEENGIEKGLEALFVETERVRRYGFTKTELNRMKSDFLRSMEQAYRERDKSQSNIFASEYVRHFLVNEPIPGISYEYAMAKQFIPDITLKEINQLATVLITDSNRVILVSAPEKEGVYVPDEEALLAVFDAAGHQSIEPYHDFVPEQPLVSYPPQPVEIIDEKYIKAMDVTEWTLANGIKVVLKPTDFKNDEVLFKAYSPGGRSLAPDSSFIACATAVSVIKEGGIGIFDRIELEKKLSGKVVSVSPNISGLTEGISGSASPQDLKTMFELIYLYITQPRKDSTAFLSFKNRIKGYIENRGARPETAFQDTIQVTLAQYHYRARPWSLALLDEMDLNRSYDFYKNRFKDTGDFLFIFVGNFKPDDLKPMIQTYIGGLPSEERGERWRDLGLVPPEGIIRKVIKRGLEPKARVRMIFSGSYEWSRQNNYNMNAMLEVMRIRLREILREDMGGTYGVGVWASKSHHPIERYMVNISFGSSPERVDELRDSIFAQIDSLKQFGPDEEYILKVKESQIRQYEVNLKENAFWLGSLYSAYFHQQDPMEILHYLDFIQKLSKETVRSAANQYFNYKNYIQVILLPEEK